MAALNEKGFERKLQQMSLAQDSVQTVSLWIIHHKKYATDIVKVWTENLKKCNPDRRLVLFYLANDVLQNSRKKGKEFSTAFSKVLLDVIHLLSEKKISDSVQRVMKIWQERKVFDSDFLENLQRKFESSQGRAAKGHHHSHSHSHSHSHKTKSSHADSDSERGTNKHTHEKRVPPPDFKPTKLIEALKAMRDIQSEVTLKESRLNSLRVDASDMEAIKQLKDRSTGAKFTSEYETASENLESFCETLNLQKEEITKLIECVEDGRAFYDSAFSEVKVIVHAYKTFGNRLNSLKKKIDHKVAKIINAEAERKKMGPIHTPQASFLTSGLPDISSAPSTPTHKSEEKSSETADTTVDNTEVADMDLDDDGDSENEESQSQSQSPSDSTSTPSSDVKATETPVSSTPSTSSLVTAAAATTAAATSASTSSGTATSFTASTSTMHVPMAVPPQMMMQQPPHMQFLPGQPGISMIPVGMPGAGQFIGMPSNYPQPMVPYGMGMHTIGTFPGQPHMATIPLPGQAPFPGMMPNLQQRMPVSMAASQLPVASNNLTPVISQSPLPGQLIPVTTQEAPLAQPASTVSPLATTTPTQSVIKPLPSSRSNSVDSTKMDESIGSPSSEASAPSPVGSPELELGGDETPETASPQRVDDVKIISVPEQTNQGTSEEASAPSTGSASPSQSSDLSKPVSAVNILAQLISRGRQLKEQTPSTSGASTPKEEPVPEVVPPKQEKPLYTLIDSLFPKLTDSLKTIREKEKDNETSTSTSEEGSPKQKIEINSMGDNDDDDDDDSEIDNEPPVHIESHGPGHMGPMGFHQQEFAHGNPRGPFAGHPHDGPMGHFPGHGRPPFRDYQERPQLPPQSPVKGPGHSPRFPGHPRDFHGPQGAFFGPHEGEPEGPRDDYRAMTQRSPRQLHSPRASFNRPAEHELELNDGPPMEHPHRGPNGPFVGGPQNHGPPERGPRFAREETHPQFHFENPVSHPRPTGPPEMHWGGPEESFPHHEEHRGPHPYFQGPRGPHPRHEGPRAPHHEGPRPHFEGPRGPRPRLEGPRGPQPNHEEPRRPHLHHEGPRMHHEGPRGPSPRMEGPRAHHPYPDGPRGPHPDHDRARPTHPPHGSPRGNIPHHEDLRGSHTPHEGPRVFQRSFSDSEGELGCEPPMKRQILEEAPPRSFSEQGRPRPGFPPSSPGFERNREMWREHEHWEHHPGPERTRPDYQNREGHLSPRFVVDHGNRPFPPHERPPYAPRRNSFKGFEQREHFVRPRFPGGHARPFY